jgi:hypothetical protein
MVECFDTGGRCRLLLHQLLQQTGDKFAHRLLGLLLVIAINANYRNILTPKGCPEMIYHN